MPIIPHLAVCREPFCMDHGRALYFLAADIY